MEWEVIKNNLVSYGTQFGVKILGAIALWIVGGLVIKAVKGLVRRTMRRTSVDETVERFTVSLLGVVLKIILVVAVLGVFGVETTTFAAVLAAAGVAIGMAWSGLLANFAAGVFMLILRPIKVGDFVSAGGELGTVEEIGLFVTTITTMDNVKTIVGNNKIFSETMKNYSANDYRRVDLKAQLDHGADHKQAIATLRVQLATIPGVRQDPAPSVEVLDFTLAGPVLAVRPYCHNDDYWDVYFATNRVIREALGDIGLPVPQTHHHVKTAA